MPSPRNGQPVSVLVKYIHPWADCAEGEVQRLPWSVAQQLVAAGHAIVITDQSSGRCVLSVPGEHRR